MPAPQKSIADTERIIHLLADQERPYIYAVQDGINVEDPDQLLIISTDTDEIVSTMQIGVRTTDLTINYPEKRLYLTDWRNNATRAIDLEIQQLVDILNLGTDVYKLNAGRAGRIYYEQEDQWINIVAVNSAAGSTISTTFVREGDGEVDPTGNYYYHSDNNSSGATLHKYDISGDGFTEIAESAVHAYGSRNLVLSPDGTRLFWKNGVIFDTDLNELGSLEDEIYESTYGGDYAFSSTMVYNANTLAPVAPLPSVSRVIAVSGNQEKLYYYDESVQQIEVMASDTFAALPNEALIPEPSNETTIVTPLAALAWETQPAVLRYQVYFGTDANAVAAATLESPEYLGEVTGGSIDLNILLEMATQYYWRVDSVGLAESRIGEIWSFQTAPFEIDPRALALDAVRNSRPQTVTIELEADRSISQWTMSEDLPWVDVDLHAGRTPAVLTVTLKITDYPTGTLNGLLHFVSGAREFDFPIELNIVDLSISKMLADPARPYIYALQTGASPEDESLLLFIDTKTENIDRALPIGFGATDLTVNQGEARLYVNNWGHPETRVVDLETWQQLPSLALGQDVYRLNAGRPGRLYVEEDNQWIDVTAIDTESGAEVAVTREREGDGEVSPNGNFYYHCTNGISNAHIAKYDISQDQWFELGQSEEHPYGSRNLVMSPDGSRLFWKNGYVYDADLHEIGYLSAEIYATSRHGELAMSSSRIYDVERGTSIYSLPFSTSVMAVAGDQTKLFLFDDGAHDLAVIPMSEIADLPPAGLNPQPADGAIVVSPLPRLAWNVDPVAVGYQIYFGADSSRVVGATTDSAEYLGEVTETSIELTDPLRLAARYFWRIDTIGYGGTETGAVWSFQTAPIRIEPTQATLTAVRGSIPEAIELQLIADRSIDQWSLSEDIPWLEADLSSGTTPAGLTLSLKITDLPNGHYAGDLVFTARAMEFVVPIALNVIQMDLFKMLADPERPVVYGLQQGNSTTEDAYLHFINPETENVERTIPIGSNATDMTINRGEGRLYVNNWLRGFTRVVDLETRQQLAPLDLGADVYKLNAGRPGRLYVEEEDQWVDINCIDTATGETVARQHAREGDGEIDPTGNYYYHCDNNISNAHITKYDISDDSFTQMAESLEHPYGSRSLLLSADGTRLFWRGYVYDADLNELGQIAGNVVATSLHGDLAFTYDGVFNTHTGSQIYTLPFSSGVQAVSPDQAKLLIYDHQQARVRYIPMSEIADLPTPGLNPDPADGSTVVLPRRELTWDLDPLAIAYQVYFGTDSTAVAEATPDGPEYLGELATSHIDLVAELELGATYFWRVDMVGFAGTVQGAVWHFDVAPLVIDPNSLDFAAVEGTSPLPLWLAISTDGETAEWSVSEEIEWLSLGQSSGSAPDSLRIDLDVSGLHSGEYTGTLRFESGEATFDVSIRMRLIQMDVSKMLADQTRPYIYALNPGSGGFEDAFLLFINTETENIDLSLPIGSNPTDLTINYGEGRLYVSNWQREFTRVVDLNTHQLLEPLALGSDVYKLNAGRPGRIYFEEEDQWLYIHCVDSATGETLATTRVREGDGEVDPTGNYYYHCGNNSTGAHLTKYDISDDVFVELAEGPDRAYGSRNLVMSADGTRLFWKNGYIYDSDVNELGRLGQEIYATTRHGEFAFSATTAFNVATFEPIYTMPTESSILAVAGDQKKLFLFNEGLRRIEAIPMDLIGQLPNLEQQRIPANGSTVSPRLETLAWDSDPQATAYRVYAGTDSTEVAGATENSPSYLGEFDEPTLNLTQPLALGATYFWRVENVRYASTGVGDVWSFHVFPLSVNWDHLDLMMPLGSDPIVRNLTIGEEALVGVSDWELEESTDWLTPNIDSGSAPSSVELSFDISGLAAGQHQGSVQLSAAGLDLELPVSIEIVELSLSMLIYDEVRPYLYGLHPGSGTDADALLVVYDTQQQKVERLIPIGSNPTDMDINYFENRLYVTNWQHDETRVIDLLTLTELQPLLLGNDVYRLNALGYGRVITEEAEGWVQARIFDTTTGAEVTSFRTREGDGEATYGGLFYYHSEQSESTPYLRKYNVSTVPPTAVATVGGHPAGLAHLVLSGDGSRLFWRGRVFSDNLIVLGDLGAEIYATNRTGTWAIGSNSLFDVNSLTAVHEFDDASTVVAASPDFTEIYRFNEATHRIERFEPGYLGTATCDLSAQRSGREVEIAWTTEGAGPGATFTVLREVDGAERTPVVSLSGLKSSEYRTVDEGAPYGACAYWLEISHPDGTTSLYGPAKIEAVPIVFGLGSNYPNPFNPTTTVQYTTTRNGRVQLKVFDLRGRLVRSLVDEKQDLGWHEAIWYGRDDRGQSVNSGVYFVQLITTEGSRTRKITLLK